MKLFSSSMAACLVSPLSWMYSFLLIHTFCLRNSSSSVFLVSSVVSTTFFDFLVVECTRSNVIFFLMLLRNVLLMRRCTFWNWTDSERIFFFSSSVSRKHFSEVLKNPSSPSSTMFPLASKSHNSSMQASYHILGQMLESCDMFHKLLLGISPFRADTCME